MLGFQECCPKRVLTFSNQLQRHVSWKDIKVFPKFLLNDLLHSLFLTAHQLSFHFSTFAGTVS